MQTAADFFRLGDDYSIAIDRKFYVNGILVDSFRQFCDKRFESGHVGLAGKRVMEMVRGITRKGECAEELLSRAERCIFYLGLDGRIISEMGIESREIRDGGRSDGFRIIAGSDDEGVRYGGG